MHRTGKALETFERFYPDLQVLFQNIHSMLHNLDDYIALSSDTVPPVLQMLHDAGHKNIPWVSVEAIFFDFLWAIVCLQRHQSEIDMQLGFRWYFTVYHINNSSIPVICACVNYVPNIPLHELDAWFAERQTNPELWIYELKEIMLHEFTHYLRWMVRSLEEEKNDHKIVQQADYLDELTAHLMILSEKSKKSSEKMYSISKPGGDLHNLVAFPQSRSKLWMRVSKRVTGTNVEIRHNIVQLNALFDELITPFHQADDIIKMRIRSESDTISEDTDRLIRNFKKLLLELVCIMISSDTISDIHVVAKKKKLDIRIQSFMSWFFADVFNQRILEAMKATWWQW